jgi:hypothetical protein
VEPSSFQETWRTLLNMHNCAVFGITQNPLLMKRFQIMMKQAFPTVNVTCTSKQGTTYNQTATYNQSKKYKYSQETTVSAKMLTIRISKVEAKK